MVKKANTPEAKAKKKAWAAFSIFIRTRDCLKYGGNLEDGMCVTCKRPKHFKQLQAGHFIGSRRNAILLDEDITHAQCAGCNLAPPRGLGGNYIEYFVFMEQEYGREAIDTFRARKYETLKMTEADWLEQAEHYLKRRQALADAYRSNPYGQELQELISLGKTLNNNTVIID